VLCDVPNAEKKKMSVRLENGDRELVITVDKPYDNQYTKSDTIRKERSYGKAERRFKLPAQLVDHQKMTATYNNGYYFRVLVLIYSIVCMMRVAFNQEFSKSSYPWPSLISLR